jgi:nicotinate-nucleotide adenylyltransferase
MKIGILGGSFDPVHLGHIAIAEAARDAHGLDRVLLVPAGRPPHKSGELAPAADRLAMVRLAIEGRAGLEASDIEIRRPGPSYTVDTLEELKRAHPDAALFFIIGADSLHEFFGWRNTRRILELARIVTVTRPGWQADFDPASFPGAPAETIRRIEADRVEIPGVPAESTRIREAVRRGEPIDREVPAPVAEYIRRQGLYHGSGPLA